jgi:DivIVA domain-containing protein
VPADLIDVSFPVAVRGYDRQAVDAYIKRVNRVIAELKVSASPPAAVRHALDQAREKFESFLQAGREAADEITASAREEAEETTAHAKAEAAELVVSASAKADRANFEAEELTANAGAEAADTIAKAKAEAEKILAEARTEAQETRTRAQVEADERLRRLAEELAALQEQGETRMREIHADTEAISKQRRDLLDDVRAMAAGLVDLANAAASRVTAPDSGERKEREAEGGDETEPSAVTEGSTQALRAVGSRNAEDKPRDAPDR